MHHICLELLGHNFKTLRLMLKVHSHYSVCIAYANFRKTIYNYTHIVRGFKILAIDDSPLQTHE